MTPAYRFDPRAEDPIEPRPKRWLWSVIRQSVPVYSEVLLAALLINLFALASPLFIMNVYDRVVPNQAVETLWVLAIGVGLVFIFDFIIRMLRAYFIDATGKNIDMKLSRIIFEQLLDLDAKTRPDSVGSLTNTVQSFETVRDFITSATISVLVDLPFVLMFLMVIWLIGGPIALVPAIAIPIVLGIGLLMQIPLSKMVAESYRHSTEKQAVLIETLANHETVKTMRAESPLQSRWENIVKASATLGVKIRSVSNLGINSAVFIQHIATVFVIVVGVYLIKAGDISMGALIASTILTTRCLAPILQVATLMTRYKQATTSLSAIDTVMKMPVERPSEKCFLNRPQFIGHYEFIHVGFNYQENAPGALTDCHFNIKAGEKVAIIGRTGSGKTTLAKIMMKLYQPTKGSVLIDGLELHQLDPAQLRHHIGYVPQDISLFHGTIKENIVIGAPYVDDSVLLSAASISGVEQFVNQHPEGYNRKVGERGEQLSGGQRQAVGIARAVLLNPSILIFDEPTNSLDDKSSALLMHKLNSYIKNKTFVLITHKRSLLALADRIIVLEKGKVYMDGPRDEVLDFLKKGAQKHRPPTTQKKQMEANNES